MGRVRCGSEPGSEAQKPRQRVSVANRKNFARPENFCAYDIKGHNLVPYCPNGFNSVWTVSIVSRQFQNCPDNFEVFQTVLKLIIVIQTNQANWAD